MRQHQDRTALFSQCWNTPGRLPQTPWLIPKVEKDYFGHIIDRELPKKRTRTDLSGAGHLRLQYIHPALELRELERRLFWWHAHDSWIVPPYFCTYYHLSRWVTLGLYIPFSVVHPSPGHVQVLDSPGFEEDKNLIRQVFRTHEVWDAAGMDCGFMLGLLLGSRSDMLEVWDVNRYDIYVRWKIR